MCDGPQLVAWRRALCESSFTNFHSVVLTNAVLFRCKYNCFVCVCVFCLFVVVVFVGTELY